LTASRPAKRRVVRHPQYGEQKQTTVVKAETPARVSLTFPK
jgi:hypothetical protein